MAKWLRDKVDHHWQERVARRGLLALLGSHTARRHYQIYLDRNDLNISTTNWKEYYIGFLLLERYAFPPQAQFAPFSQCTELDITFKPSDPELLRQFPANYTGTIIEAEASKPYYQSFNHRRNRNGSERGIFRLLEGHADGIYAYFRDMRNKATRSLIVSTERVQFTALSFSHLKAQLLLHKQPSPFPVSLLDWALCVLEAIELAHLAPQEWGRLFGDMRLCASALKLRHRRVINVVFGMSVPLSA